MKTFPFFLLVLACGLVRAEDIRLRADIEYGRTDEGPLRLDLHLPEGPGPFPWLIRFSSARERPDASARLLLDAGYALAFAAYDAEDSGRVFPPWPQAPRSIRRGILFLKANAEGFRLDPERAAIWGWSRGGYAAALGAATAWAAAFDDPDFPGLRPDLRACVTLAGDFGFVPRELQGLDLQLQPSPGHNTDPDSRVSVWLGPEMPPTLSLRGGADGSADDLRAFHQALTLLGVPARHRILEGRGHGLSGNDVAEEILAWLDSYLKPAVAPARAPVDGLAALLSARGYAAARRRHPESTARVDAAEALDLRRGIESRLHLDPAFWVEDLERWRALAADADLEARAAQRLAESEAAVRAWNAESARLLGLRGEWPASLPVPAWADGHGADGFGPWTTLRLPGEGDIRLRFRPLPAGGWLAETETTQETFVRIFGENPSHFADQARHPVERVSHDMALAFCERWNDMFPGARARLPLIAEWQSAFGPADRRAPLSAQAWMAVNGGGRSHAVASLAPNESGFYDLLGNVFEWLGDERKERPLHYRFYAGGGFASRAERCDPAWIVAHNGSNRTFYHGFRIHLEP